MLARVLRNNSDLALVGGMIGILLILFAPIPTPLLDFLIILNLSFGLTILMLTFYVRKPVEFSTFPSLLLVATLFRLSLNVAATRLILTDGDAGQVIGAVGSFAVQGNFVIGLVVFFILVVVQYVVVTSGAQRVSEVAARFTLDAVPGQQMSIDADLNMGLIDQQEAQARRKTLEREAAFYGAMDGASKFVKGDAIAGIVIVLINIIAGWIIGVAERGLEWSQALQQYTLLTIGDGIVTQVPALVISIATGIIVTQSAADRQLSTEVLAQLGSVPRVLVIVMSALVLLLLLPGMPKWPISILLLIFAAAWWGMRRWRGADDPQAVEGAAADGDQAFAKVPPAIGVSLGKELAAAWLPLRAVIVERLATLRRQRSEASGLVVPPIIIEDGSSLGLLDYEIALFGTPYARGTIRPDRTLAIRSAETLEAIQGIEARDPAFGLPGTWIEDEDREHARATGHTLIDPITVLTTHLGEIVRAEAALLLTRADVMRLLDEVRMRQPGLIEELVPNIMSISDIQRVLQNLVAEYVPIRSMEFICEILVDVARTSRDHAELTELTRQRLSHVICNELKGDQDALPVVSLDPRIEAQITEAVSKDITGSLIIEPRLAEQLLRKIAPVVEKMNAQGTAPVLLCGPTIRKHLRTFLRRSAPQLAVISVNEVPQSIDLTSFEVIKAD